MNIFPEIDAHTDPATLPQVLIQMLFYGYVLLFAADMIGDGAELLLLVPKYQGLVGSIVIPILGAVPDGMLVLVSGMGSPDVVQKEVAVGMGALAGSTIMLLTVPWFLSIYTGRVTIVDGEPTYKRPLGAGEDWSKLVEGTPAWQSGVVIDEKLKSAAKLMLLSATPYLVVLAAALFVDEQSKYLKLTPPEQALERKAESAFEHPVVLVGALMTLGFFVYYNKAEYDGADDEDGQAEHRIWDKLREGIKEGEVTLKQILLAHKNHETVRQCTAAVGNGTELPLEAGLLKDVWEEEKYQLPATRWLIEAQKSFFKRYDKDNSGSISADEFFHILEDLGEAPLKEKCEEWLDVLVNDKERAKGEMNFEEFCVYLKFWMESPPKLDKTLDRVSSHSSVLRVPSLDHAEQDEEEEDMPDDLQELPWDEQQKMIQWRAFTKMAFGTVLVLLFSDPMCDMLGLLADTLGIGSFYVSFVLAPLASNASELVAAMKLAKKKTKDSIVQSLQSLLGAGIMNNTFCLGIFFVLIMWKDLAWQFTAETASIGLIEILIGGLVLIKQKQTLLEGYGILSLYVFALFFVWFLEKFMGLD